jgi:hypothetical protein
VLSKFNKEEFGITQGYVLLRYSVGFKQIGLLEQFGSPEYLELLELLGILKVFKQFFF